MATTANWARFTQSLDQGQDTAKVTPAMPGNTARCASETKEAGLSGIVHDSVGKEACTLSAERQVCRRLCQLLPDNDKTLP